MNHAFIPAEKLDAPETRTTLAAEGLPRRAWTVAEIEAMVAAGIIPEKERFELIGGEVVPMSPKGNRHEWLKAVLNRHFQRIAADDLIIVPETTLRLDDRSFLEPDFCVFSGDLAIERLNGSEVLLAIEIADSSLRYDLGRKIGIYAAHGVREVWVVNAATLVTRVHRKLGTYGYGEITDHDFSATLAPILAPSLLVSLAALDLKPIA